MIYLWKKWILSRGSFQGDHFFLKSVFFVAFRLSSVSPVVWLKFLIFWRKSFSSEFVAIVNLPRGFFFKSRGFVFENFSGWTRINFSYLPDFGSGVVEFPGIKKVLDLRKFFQFSNRKLFASSQAILVWGVQKGHNFSDVKNGPFSWSFF